MLIDFEMNKILTTASSSYLQVHYKEMMDSSKILLTICLQLHSI